MEKSIEIIGLEDVNRFLKGVDKKVNKKIINAGLGRTGLILKNEMKRRISTGRGGSEFANQIKIWQGTRTRRALKWIGWKRLPTKTDKQKEVFNKKLNERSGLSDRARRAWMANGAYWLEYGTMEYMDIPRAAGTDSLSDAVKRTGAPRKGRIAPIAWFRNSVDVKMDPMMKDFTKNMQVVIDRYIKRMLKRAS